MELLLSVLAFFIGVFMICKPEFVYDITVRSICINDCNPTKFRIFRIRLEGVFAVIASIGSFLMNI